MLKWVKKVSVVLAQLGFLVVMILGVTGTVTILTISLQPMTPSDFIQLFIMAILFMTVMAALYDQYQSREYTKSEAYLNKSLDLAEKAHTTLSQDPLPGYKASNDRVIWVTTARLIQRSLKLSELISEEAHQEIYEAERDLLRHKFSKLLRLGDTGMGFAFYTGNQITSCLNYTNLSGNPRNCNEMIPPEVVSIVCRYGMFPENYQDLIKRGEKLTEDELERLWISGDRAIGKYFVFRDEILCTKEGFKAKLLGREEYTKINIETVKGIVQQKAAERYPICLDEES